MQETDETAELGLLPWRLAANQVLISAISLQRALKYNPNWQLQPRAPAGSPGGIGGQWIAYLVSASGSFLPILQRLGPRAVQTLREAARRVRPILQRLPKRWDEGTDFPPEEDFDDETRRISTSSWQRHGYPTVRFRSERELRNYLGPAGNGREWHHIVEKRLAENGRFRPEIIHSTDNIVSLPVEVHRRISAKMSMRSEEFEGEVRRYWIEKLDFDDQYNHGLRIIEETLEEFGYDPADF